MTAPAERKLAAILAADAVGYSRLMAADEEGTVTRLRQYREVVDGLIASHRGRLFGTAGDSVIAEFASAVEAVRCAVDIQRALQARAADVPEDGRMQFRIGVNLGDVVIEGNNLLGDGINVAARLQALADPGGICISRAVHEQVLNKVDVTYDDLGARSVKNIPVPVNVYRVRLEPAAPRQRPSRTRSGAKTAALSTAALLLAVAAGVWLSWPAPLGLVLDLAGLSSLPVNPPPPDKPSLVVLPFANLSDDPHQEYLADGLTEDVTADLGQFKWIFVISRSSAYTYKGTAVSAGEVSRQLGVRYLVEGSVRKVGDRVRMTVQLIDATRDVSVWSERYDREIQDLPGLQSEISERILGALRVEIPQAESARLRRKRTENLSAYEAFIRGVVELRRATRDGVAAARPLLERAIDADPEFATAYALLALTYTTEAVVRCPYDRRQLLRARELAQRAIALDPFEPMAHLALCAITSLQGLGPEALAAGRRSVELAPNFDTAHSFLGTALLLNGSRMEAIGAYRQALRLSPRPPAPFIGLLGVASYMAGRREQGVEFFEQARAANPDVIPIRVVLTAHYEVEGHHEKAHAVAQEVLHGNPECTAEEAVETLPFPAPLPDLAARLRAAGFPEKRNKAAAIGDAGGKRLELVS